MKKVNLFYFKRKKITNHDIFYSLCKLGVKKCDILYVHSDISFGVPNSNLLKKEILENLLQIFLKLEVKTIIFPTYSFSFCKNEKFDYKNNNKQGYIK